MQKNLLTTGAALAVLLFFGTGCKNHTTSPLTTTATVTANQDAAQSIANSVGEDNGGVTDEIGDAVDATGSSGISANVGSPSTEGGLLKGTSAEGDTIIKTFNASDTSWTIYVSRNRVGLFGRQSGFTRTYSIKFIDANGIALPRYIIASPADTASTINFMVLNGTGYTITQYASTHLLSISSNLVITGANTPVVTVNGTFTRTGTDTITNLSGTRMRVLNHTLSATLVNVTRQRIPRYAMVSGVPRATGGTITGTYTATVTVLAGTSYSERNFTKTFTITFGTDGSGSMDVGGASFNCNLQFGEAIPH